ncbi:5'-nucleotidase C-terminal domain-containing protein [Evansella sp. AB-rgal1]|uniref:5'-nucleotidase C-terminal domain-containing protein n=1 Tax=Evansella sp. AB-rgal1 TaxID=3242696 RepID=UPI00359E3620
MMKKILVSLLSLSLLLSLVGQVVLAHNDNSVSRQEFLTAFIDEIGINVEQYEGAEVPFEDVSDEFAPYVEASIRLGITNGMRNNFFGSNEKITREQALTFMIRSLNLDVNNQELDTDLSFTDLEQSWAKQELITSINLELIQGYSDHSLRPNDLLTKEHMNILFDRYHSNFDRITFVHTNDIHGRVMYNEANGEMGLAKIANIANEVRENNPNTLLIDLGDTFHGTTYVNFNEGEAAAKAMNQMGYDLMVAGNHDFNFGYERLLELDTITDFPILGGNVLVIETGETLLAGTHVVEIGGKKLGFIGLVATDTVIKTHPNNVEGLQFNNEVEVAQHFINELQDDVDHIILTSHIGYSVDKRVAEKVEGIDVIFGGHSHSTLEKPVLHNNTYIAQAYEHSKAVGISQLVFFKEELLSVSGHLVRDHSHLIANSDVEATLNQYKKEVDTALGEVIGTVDTTLIGFDREVIRKQESNLGNLITDAMRDATDAQIAFTNGGGIRADIEAGEVKMDHVISAFPFVNTVIALELTGKHIMKSLEHSVRNYPDQNGGFLHVSGLTFTFDPSKPVGQRITEVLVDGKELDVNEKFVVATNDFLAAGGDGYEWLQEGKLLIDTGELLSTVAINYIAAGKPIPGVENRIKK